MIVAGVNHPTEPGSLGKVEPLQASSDIQIIAKLAHSFLPDRTLLPQSQHRGGLFGVKQVYHDRPSPESYVQKRRYPMKFHNIQQASF